MSARHKCCHTFELDGTTCLDTKVIRTCNISAAMDISDSELANLSIPQCKKLLTSFLHFDDTLTASQVHLLTAQIVAHHHIFALQEHCTMQGNIEIGQ